MIIARFQWVGVMDCTTSTESASQSDKITASVAAAAAADDDDKAPSSPHMQYFIKVLLYLLSL